MRKKVLIIGGGFGGLRAAKALRRAPVDITLIDRANHHLFQPLLYQVATAGLTAEEIAMPIRSVLRDQANVTVLMGEVTRIDLAARRVDIAEQPSQTYDCVVVAAGAQNNYFGHPEWAEHAIGLKDLEDAFAIRRRVLSAFEHAALQTETQEKKRLLTFCVIGGGPTGVEMAGALQELSRHALSRDFRSIDPDMVHVELVEAGPRLLAGFDPKLSQNALQELQNMGVKVRLRTAVSDVQPDRIRLGETWLPCSLVVWAAGVKPRPLAANLGIDCDARGHVRVTQDCSLPGHPEAFVIGDMAAFVPQGEERPLPGVAPVAMQQADHVARSILADLRGKPRRPFIFRDKGMMATIGTSRAVLQSGKIKMTGFLAWLAWIVVHVYYIVGFRNRALVLSEWWWAYVTNRRGARVLTRAWRDIESAPATEPAVQPDNVVPISAARNKTAEPMGAP